MVNDKAIEYNSKLHKVTRTITKMQEIGLNVDNYNKLLKEIGDELASSLSENMSAFFSDNMKTDVLNAAHSKAINKLDLLLKDMSRYEIYLKTAGFCGSLRTFLKSDDPDSSKLIELRTKLLELLEGIKNSETLDYQTEGPLVEDIYNLAYEFIKVELRESGTSLVLSEIQKDEVDKNNIERAIIDELEHLNLNEPKYQQLVAKKHEIDSLGISASYVNEDFITHILNSTTTYEMNQKRLKELSQKLERYYNQAVALEEQVNNKKSKIDAINQSRKDSLKDEYLKIGKNIIMTLSSIGVIIGLGIGAFKFTKKYSTGTKNKVTTTTYSTIADPVTKEEYLKKNEVRVGNTLYEYEPYKEVNTRYARYSRHVTSYDVTSADDLSFAEYLALDLEHLGITGQKKYNGLDILSLEDAYQEPYWELKKVSVDENDTITYTSKPKMIGIGLVSLVVAFILDILIESYPMERIFKENAKFWYFIGGLKNIKEQLTKIKKENKNLKRKEKELANLYIELNQLIAENADIINKLEQAVQYSDNENKEEITQKLARVRKISSLIPRN